MIRLDDPVIARRVGMALRGESPMYWVLPLHRDPRRWARSILEMVGREKA